MKQEDSITDVHIKEYFKRCFFAVDGLWFMLLEKESNFQKALEIDRRVWQALPKIQARKIRQLINLKNSDMEDLLQALEFKFQAEEYRYEVRLITNKKLEIALLNCPWLIIMQESGREHLASEIGKTICRTEYQVWAKEFDATFQNNLDDSLCSNGQFCYLRFAVQDQDSK